jgi:hypothetical protein
MGNTSCPKSEVSTRAGQLQFTDPAGFGGHVGGFAGVSTVDEAVSRFTTAYNRALKAEQFAAAGKIELATDEWRKIFGTYFPAFG